MIERVPTGITGLDDLLGGGFPKGRSILVSGTCGSGKTLFSLQFVYRGASEYGDPGIFVTFEERPEFLREDASELGWDLERLEEENKLAIVDATSYWMGIPSDERYVETRPFDLDSILDGIARLKEEIGARRIAIDSLAAMMLHYEDQFSIRRDIAKLATILRRLGCTTILTTEIEEGSPRISKYGVEEFVCEGVIILTLERIENELRRFLWIRKMRGINHSRRRHPFEIGDGGIVVYPAD